ncbi:DUF1616 domain-containing protein [Haloarcula sp. S1CR25-12]|uniref:DUF1616 domain-containing protein n=1 Tax=Haloarcula saliterrae TaxID=2950534 RepID=A0ABU2FGQ0_9EURY|nr:DUF1616 domain-containing protein [Haloarcula sp. S1CR25-12]MDS0261434.1 DUF1616 domain-containing protein [Haloarcula sp. S1CR25-12]
MSRLRNIWLLVPRPLARVPADLAAVGVLVLATNVLVFLPVLRDTPLRVLVGIPLVLFAPGYALLAALFPESGLEKSSVRDDSEPKLDSPAEGVSIGGLERVALSLGLSIAVVALAGLLLNYTPWGIRSVPIMVALSGFTLSFTGIAVRRRWVIPEADRFRVPYRDWYARARAEFVAPDSQTDLVLNVGLVVSVLLLATSVGYAVSVPQEGESFSEFYLVTENESGQLVADDYPTEFDRGQPRSLVVGISNNEHEQTSYTVIVQLQRVTRLDNETRIDESTQLARYQPTLAHNETWTRQHSVAPETTGSGLRLRYLLYRGQVDEPIDRSAAYRKLHLWVDVTQ